MVQTDTTETSSLLSTSGTSPDQPALPDLRADQDRVRDRTLRNREKATRWLQLESHSLLGPHGKRNLGMGICWAESSSAPASHRGRLPLISPSSSSAEPCFWKYYEPHVCEIKNKSDLFSDNCLNPPSALPSSKPILPRPLLQA